MKTHTLKQLIHDWNVQYFNELAGQFGAPAPLDLSCAVAHYRTFPQAPHFCGTFLGSAAFQTWFENPTDKESLAVGAILDSTTDKTELDLDVVVAIGINYWQFPRDRTTLPLPSNWTDTGLRPRLDSVLKQLDQTCWQNTWSDRLRSFDGSYHLVAMNFFPWVTSASWQNLNTNRIGEAIALHERRPPRTTELIVSFLGQLDETDRKSTSDFTGELALVAFHGASSSVPILALPIIDECQRMDVHTNYVFSDNLSMPGPAANAVTIHPGVPFPIRRSETTYMNDE